jgi:cellulose synthase/poly-beta-1,6-N-acetylglucosamine synthase-like glycosyltransferase
VLLEFSLYDLSILSFVQLALTTVLVLSPVREIGNRFRWTGSRITEVIVNTIGAVGITAASCGLTHVLWGLPIDGGLDTSAFLLVLVSILVITLQPERNLIGQVFYASFGSASVAFGAWATYLTVVAPRSIPETLTASLVLVLNLGAFLVWMSNVNYQSDVLTRARRGRPVPKADPTYQPMVSLHIPAYNEPPELLIETIKAVERIDYPNFEIVVIDNNTQDHAVWGPVEEYCRDRPRVRFVHVAPWPGYKAGACNLALREYTDPRAEIIGLIDADDLVEPHYLRETVSYFSDPHVGFVQTFEGNRDFEDSTYYTACVDSYQAFYLSVMSSRNERDTVPFVGTMGLFRRSALTDIGGWNEWCICEDTEASLRVLKEGWSGLYLPRCFGRGIVPPSWAGMLTQRHRWCFGAMQILRLHWRSLMPWDRSPDNHLTPAQRRDYLMASLSWFRDLIMLVFSLLLLAIGVLTATHSGFAVAPLDHSWSLLPLSLIVIATFCMMATLRHWTTMSYRRALYSLLISLAVTFVIARGCIEGVARRDGVFLRTSKAGGRQTFFTALGLASWETVLAAALYTAAGFLFGLKHPPWVLIFLLVAQATIYVCAPIAAVWNLHAQRAERVPRRSAHRRRRAQILMPRPAATLLGALVVAALACAFIAPPTSLLHASAVARGGPWPQALLASPRTEVYLSLGSSSTTGSAYYRITPVHLSGLATTSAGASAGVGISFTTSSQEVLSEVLRAAVDGGVVSSASLAFRTPSPSGMVTKLVDTFATAVVTSITEPSPGTPSGSVTLLLPAATAVTNSPGALQHAGPFGSPSAAPATRAYLTMGHSTTPYRITAVNLSRVALYAPLQLSFTTTAGPVLERIFQAQAASSVMPRLTLSVRQGLAAKPVRRTFSKASVSSVTETLSAPFSGSASLAIPAR